MATNPNPTHITAEMWWFVEELDKLDGADTVYAGSWGDFKPGYHCDAYTLWWHKDKSGAYIWRNDYSTKLRDDLVLGTPLEHFGAAVDLTFRSAQAGNPATIRKYGGRVRAAWLARDPRLKGWREVLIQGDADTAADGYDFVSWTERTPDSTHTWHGHFSVLRRYVETLAVYEAMLSILRGETLDQWLARGVNNMQRIARDATTKQHWMGDGIWRRKLTDQNVKDWRAAGIPYDGDQPDMATYGADIETSTGAGLSEAAVRDIAVQVVSGTTLTPPA